MSTIVPYTTSDAVYGTGTYGSASYGVANHQVILDGIVLTSSVNSLFETAVEITPGIQANISVGTLSFFTENVVSLDSLSLTSTVGSSTSSGIIFDYEAVKEQYDRRRTIYVGRAA